MFAIGRGALPEFVACFIHGTSSKKSTRAVDEPQAAWSRTSVVQR
jgi:hypothetical protein